MRQFIYTARTEVMHLTIERTSFVSQYINYFINRQKHFIFWLSYQFIHNYLVSVHFKMFKHSKSHERDNLKNKIWFPDPFLLAIPSLTVSNEERSSSLIDLESAESWSSSIQSPKFENGGTFCLSFFYAASVQRLKWKVFYLNDLCLMTILSGFLTNIMRHITLILIAD